MRKPMIGILALLLAPATALAQTTPADAEAEEDDYYGDSDTAPPTDPEDLPPPESSNEPLPPVAAPATPVGGIVRQAGVGSQTGYGRAGVLELGGSAGFTASSEFTTVNLTPSIGWFVADNLQLSGRLSFSYVSTDETEGSITTVLVEPSYHLPFNRQVFGFLGVGAGVAHVEGPGFGFALAPRAGANIMIGRSGILTPALSWQYTTHDAMETEMGALLVVTSAVQANVGYTVMW